ncbi:hypothetical protein L249_4130 [Ophiocordyceps polyrhachis-furcata BCC 54312]|uniref:Uncharacterized protein n=1 Tax=Ophiocordyceps polyrhachis-furcata BCC 54312 TaxID=1330021 RepID=A0A367L6B2_9HYPO|nr:hypothetical protein L249_4130 [Ophiocordyceps polyrhachis-furcata BCC 54312]
MAPSLWKTKTVFRCKNMMKGLLHTVLAVVPIIPEDLALDFCRKGACAEAIVDVLPVDLVQTMSVNLNLTATAIVEALRKDLVSAQDDYVIANLKWYAQAAAAEQQVCWQDPIPFRASDFISMLGILSATLTEPKSISQDVPSRFLSLPPGELRPGEAHCVSKSDLAYYAIQVYTRANFVTIEFFTGTRFHIGRQAMQEHADQWAGMMGRGLSDLMRYCFRCPEPDGCVDMLEPGKPYQPSSNEELWDRLQWLLQRNHRFCFSFSKVDRKPNDYWIVGDKSF